MAKIRKVEFFDRRYFVLSETPDEIILEDIYTKEPLSIKSKNKHFIIYL
jgi:hypothetical protein